MPVQIQAGLPSKELLVRTTDGLNFEHLTLNNTQEAGWLQANGPDVRVRIHVSLFRLEGQDGQMADQANDGVNFSQVVYQIGEAATQCGRLSVSLVEPDPTFQQHAVLGCMYVVYETANTDAWNAGTCELYIDQVEHVA